jgi:hypothetical protein
MKQMLWVTLLALLFNPVLITGEAGVKMLPMEVPANAVPGEGTLLVRLDRLEALVNEMASFILEADIALLDRQEASLAILGHIKKGKIKWNHKVRQGKFLAVAFSPDAYAALAESIRARTPRPGYRLAVRDEATQALLQDIAVTFWEFPDLAVQLNYPVNARPGGSLQKEVTVSLENKGDIAAKDIHLDIILSLDDKIQWRGPGKAGDDMLLENGRETVPSLEAGQQITVHFSGSLKLPDDIPPGKHYLAAVADPEDIIDELSEENNVHSGFIMITVPEPSAFTVEMPETLLHFKPADYGFEIVCAGSLLSDGKDWKLCRMKPNVYQFQHVSWKDFFWEIDTYAREVYEIKGAIFCKKGGQDRELKIKVEVTGGSLLIPPSSFTLKLVQTSLRFEPGTKKFTLLSYGKPIFHMPFWWICRRDSYLYQMRCALWQDFFWQVDTFRKEASLVSGGKFCSTEGSAAKLPLLVKIED